jgi:RNA polymerase sigma-70 factor (ECF subfamily)
VQNLSPLRTLQLCMEGTGSPLQTQPNTLSDSELIQRILAGESQLYEVIIRRYNQRLYRVTRSMLLDPDESEDVIQETYVRAFEHLGQFEGRALFSTWLTKIAVYEALNRMKERRRRRALDSTLEQGFEQRDVMPNPEQERLAAETRAIIEDAIDRLPASYRSVFVMRWLEDMSTSETAQCLDLSEENVKTRLLRARQMLRRSLYETVDAASAGAFQFMGERCDRVTANVMGAIGRLSIRGHDAGESRSLV